MSWQHASGESLVQHETRFQGVSAQRGLWVQHRKRNGEKRRVHGCHKSIAPEQEKKKSSIHVPSPTENSTRGQVKGAEGLSPSSAFPVSTSITPHCHDIHVCSIAAKLLLHKPDCLFCQSLQLPWFWADK